MVPRYQKWWWPNIRRDAFVSLPLPQRTQNNLPPSQRTQNTLPLPQRTKNTLPPPQRTQNKLQIYLYTDSIPCAVCLAIMVIWSIRNLVSCTCKCLYRLCPSHHCVTIARWGLDTTPINSRIFKCLVFLSGRRKRLLRHQMHYTLQAGNFFSLLKKQKVSAIEINYA